MSNVTHATPVPVAEALARLSWHDLAHDGPIGSDVALLTTLQNAMRPAGGKAAAVVLAKLAGFYELRGSIEDASEAYEIALAPIPDDLLMTAYRRTLAEWRSPQLPPPGFVRDQIREELAERDLARMKLETRLRAEKNVRVLKPNPVQPNPAKAADVADAAAQLAGGFKPDIGQPEHAYKPSREHVMAELARFKQRTGGVRIDAFRKTKEAAE